MAKKLAMRDDEMKEVKRFEKWVEKNWGKRCFKRENMYQPGCGCCEAWWHFDQLTWTVFEDE